MFGYENLLGEQRVRWELMIYKGNLVIFGRAQRINLKTRMSFLFMDLQSSINSNARFFTNLKRNFFQKVAFITYQTLFLGWLFWKRAFWASNTETNGHLKILTKILDRKENEALKIEIEHSYTQLKYSYISLQLDTSIFFSSHSTMALSSTRSSILQTQKISSLLLNRSEERRVGKECW